MDISIIIPFYEGDRYLKVLSQMVSRNVSRLDSGVSVEMIIVNDSPWTAVNCPDIEVGFSIRVISNDKNLGIHGTRIHGIKEARGRFVLMLDQDDQIEDSFLKDTYKAIGDADVCVTNGLKVLASGDRKIYSSVSKQKKIKSLFHYIYLENRILSPGQCLIRKSSIPAEWLERPLKYNGADDLLLWVLMLCRHSKFTMLNEDLYRHVETGLNVSKDDLNMARSVEEASEIMSTVDYVPFWVSGLLKRKNSNDIFYVTHGKDKYWDYRLLEMIREKTGRVRG